MTEVRPRSERRPDRRSMLARRRHQHVDTVLAPLLQAFRARNQRASTHLIEDAYVVARDAHRDQVRRSGDPYIAHPLGVAMILAELGLDDVTVASALLHDAVEDTDAHPRRSGARPSGRTSRRSSTASRSSIGSSSTPRRSSRRRRCARCSSRWPRTSASCSSSSPTGCTTCGRSPRCPRRSRCGSPRRRSTSTRRWRTVSASQDVKWQLEDLAFAVLHPKRYAEIEQMVADARTEREPSTSRGVVAEVSAAPRRPAHRRRGEWPPEALLVDLREDGRAGQGVRGDP